MIQIPLSDFNLCGWPWQHLSLVLVEVVDLKGGFGPGSHNSLRKMNPQVPPPFPEKPLIC